MSKIKKYFKQPAGVHHYLISVVLMLGIAASVMNVSQMRNRLLAANPAFSFSQSGDTLIMHADGSGEGTGLLGVEIHVNYDKTKVKFNLVDFGTCLFDNCIDVSQEGTLRFFAASSSGGKALTKKDILAKVSLNFLANDSVEFLCTKSQVITETEVVEDRDCTSFSVKKGVTTQAVCGNQKVEAAEECDDGNAKDGDGCSAKCVTEGAAQAALCGNTKVETGEQCDDGNKVDGDGCSASCNTEVKNPVCGNKVVENNEQCDDGNVNDGDGCSAKCVTEGVGQAAVCGNTKEETGEQCDDGNQVDGDGCSASCQEEADETPGAICGNNAIEGDEQCDDGNVVNGDGCSSACGAEAPSKKLVSIDASLSSGSAPTKEVGENYFLNAWAYFSDSSQAVNITSKAIYENQNPGIGQLTGSAVTGLAPGTVQISATYTEGGITRTDTVSMTFVQPAGGGEGEGEGEIGGGEGEGEGEIGGEGEGGGEGEEGGGGEGEGEGEIGGGRRGELIGEGEGEGGEEIVGDKAEGEISGFSGGSLRESAPSIKEVEEQALKEAEVVVQTRTVVVQPAIVVQAPKKEEVPNQLQLCTRQYSGVDFVTSADTDQDGLSNKTECYLKTHPQRPDTDGDTCWDGAEVNELARNPLDPGDCGQRVDQREAEEARVAITDPQPGWILKNLQVAGIAPEDTHFVTAVVFQGERQVIQDLIEGVSAVVNASESASVLSAIETLNQKALPAAGEFIVEYSDDYDYENLRGVVERLNVELVNFQREVFGLGEGLEVTVSDALVLALEQLAVLRKEKITVGTVKNLSDTELSGKPAKKFELVASAAPDNNKVYDLVAIATLADGSSRSSAPVRFGMSDSVQVGAPKPRSIGNQSIPSEPTAFKNIWIGNVRAADLQDGVEIEIDQLQPTVSGDTEFGSQVFAVWNSVVLASSVISDSEEGAFEIQAPKELETDLGHRVTLYAVKADEGGAQARSESVNVFFRIKPVPAFLAPALWALGILLGLGLITLALRRRLGKAAAPLKQVESLYHGPSVSEAMPSDTSPAETLAHEEAKAMQGEVIPAPLSPLEAEFEQAFHQTEEHQAEEAIPVREVTPAEESEYEKLEDQAAEAEEEAEKIHQ